MGYLNKTLLIYIILQTCNLPGITQQFLFDPFPQNNKGEYHLDFTQYFVSEDGEKKDLDRFYSNLDRFYSFKDKSTLSARNLVTALMLQDSLLVQFNRHDKSYPQLNQRWITASLLYEDPYYEVNYVLGSMLALKYYQLYYQDKKLFSKNYIDLLKNGFNATPQMLLKNYLGIDIDNPNLVKEAIGISRKRLNQLDKLYN